MKSFYKKSLSLFMCFWSLLVYSGVFPHSIEVFYSPAKETLESFPCATHSCGCKTALECKTHCCCSPKPASKPKTEQSVHDTGKTVTTPLNTFMNASCKRNTDESVGTSFQQIKAIENGGGFFVPRKKEAHQTRESPFNQEEHIKKIPSPG